MSKTKEKIKLKHFQDSNGNKYNSAYVELDRVAVATDASIKGFEYQGYIQPDGSIEVVKYDSSGNESDIYTEKSGKTITDLFYQGEGIYVKNGDSTTTSVQVVFLDGTSPEIKLATSTANKLKGIFEDDENTSESVVLATSTETTDTPKKSRLASIFDDLDTQDQEQNAILEAAKKAQEAVENRSVDEKIAELYAQCYAKAKAKDPDDIISTYVEDVFNPATTTLDKGNLYFNLLILSRLQELEIMDFHFDEDMVKPYVAEYSLAHPFWNEIMSSGMDTESKYGKVLDKNFRIAFYSAMFQSMANSADKTAYNNYKRKWDLALEDDDKPTKTLEEGVVDFVKEKSVDNSVIMITPDLTPFFELDEKNTEEFDPDAQIKPIGKWKNRFVYEINVDKIAFLKGFKRGAFFIKGGNKYIINPAKPLAYYNVIDNPFLEKPSLKMYINLEFKFFNSATTFLRVEDI